MAVEVSPIMPDSAFLPAADTRIAHSGQTAAFIPGSDAQSTFCLRYETYLLYSAVVRFKLTVIDKSGFGHTAFKPALQSPGVGFGQVVAGIHGNNRTLRLNSGFQIRGDKNFKKGGRFRMNHHDWRI